MKFIVWGINYAPEPTGIAPYNTVLCEYLSKNHQVQMVTTFPYYPSWNKNPQDKGKLFETTYINKIPIHRCWHYVPKRINSLKRILHELSFVFTSTLRILTLPHPDAIIVISPPLLLGFAATFVKFIKNSPYTFHVQDLQPDAAIHLGMIKQKWFIKILYILEKIAYHNAAFISGISEDMLQTFHSKKIKKDKIIYLPNGTNLQREKPISNAFRKRFNFQEDDFIVLYSGNLGFKQGLKAIIDAAKNTHHQKIKFIICGDGAYRAEIEKQITPQIPLKLLPLQERNQFEEMLVDADVCLVTQAAKSGNAFLPSKLLTILAYEKPVIACTDSDSALANAIHQGRFGHILPAEDGLKLAQMLEKLYQEKADLENMGKNGRKWVEQFDFNKILPAYEARLIQYFNKQT